MRFYNKGVKAFFRAFNTSDKRLAAFTLCEIENTGKELKDKKEKKLKLKFTLGRKK
tara:strand:+ start:838 stop:1005 length:168 start_codon:yes stop_codon:yes gene_type:complete